MMHACSPMPHGPPNTPRMAEDVAFPPVGVRERKMMADLDINAAAADVAGQRNALTERFAHRLTSVCLTLSGARRACVTTDKPQALPSGIATVATMLSRTEDPHPVLHQEAAPSRSIKEEA